MFKIARSANLENLAEEYRETVGANRLRTISRQRRIHLMAVEHLMRNAAYRFGAGEDYELLFALAGLRHCSVCCGVVDHENQSFVNFAAPKAAPSAVDRFAAQLCDCLTHVVAVANSLPGGVESLCQMTPREQWAILGRGPAPRTASLPAEIYDFVINGLLPLSNLLGLGWPHP